MDVDTLTRLHSKGLLRLMISGTDLGLLGKETGGYVVMYIKARMRHRYAGHINLK